MLPYIYLDNILLVVRHSKIRIVITYTSIVLFYLFFVILVFLTSIFLCTSYTFLLYIVITLYRQCILLPLFVYTYF
jgi:hypothetical protein